MKIFSQIENTQIISEIAADIASIENDRMLYHAINFNKRSDALDFLDFHIIDRIEGLKQEISLKSELNELKLRTIVARELLQKIDNDLFYQLRAGIKNGIYRKATFTELINKYCIADNSSHKPGYDNLDIFINGLLLNQPLPEATIELTHEMVFYQQTPARVIFELIERANLERGDVFYDLGSGLGQVVILLNLISGIKAIGIEYEPAYCQYAKNCVQSLNLSNIDFINTDARDADYAEGTVFFMYTPFTGSMLQHMLDILKAESQNRVIRIFSYGPCSTIVAVQDWLEPVNGVGDNLYELYEFRSIVI